MCDDQIKLKKCESQSKQNQDSLEKIYNLLRENYEDLAEYHQVDLSNSNELASTFEEAANTLEVYPWLLPYGPIVTVLHHGNLDVYESAGYKSPIEQFNAINNHLSDLKNSKNQKVGDTLILTLLL